MASTEDPNWGFDYALIDELGLPDVGVGMGVDSLERGFDWSGSGQEFTGQTDFSVEVDNSLVIPDELKEDGSRKRVRSASASSGSKACKEKMRRDKLNDRFMELGCILDPGRPPKMDKALILNEAVRLVTQLRDETEKLKECKDSLLDKITELKAEKNELRDEKQRLKIEKETLEMQVKAYTAQPSFLPHPPAMPGPFAAQGQVVGGKFLPYMSYPPMPMWQFMPPTAFDTSEDHVLRPPVA